MIVANPTPIYPGTILTAPLRLALLNADHTGGGVLSTLVTAVAAASGGKGAMVSRINVRSSAAAGASTPMVARLWRVSTGAVITLEDEVAIPTATPGTTAVGAGTSFPRTNITLAPGEALKITQTVSENVDYCAEYGEY